MLNPTISQTIFMQMLDGKPRLLRELATLLNKDINSVRRACQSLAKRNLVSLVSGIAQLTAQGNKASQHSLLNGNKGKMASIYKRSLRARAWSIMRIRDWFSLDDLLLTIADGSEKTAESNLRRYITALEKADYLIKQKRDPQRYRLVKNTGQIAPALNNVTHTLTDINTGEVYNV